MTQSNEIKIEIHGNATPEKQPDPVVRALDPGANMNWKFSSRDGKTWVNLTHGFLALSTESYTVWEDFCSTLQPCLEALTKWYAPSFFSRIGLRYIDVIKRSSLGLAGVNWDALITPPYCGLLGTEIGGSVLGLECVQEVLLADASSIARLATRTVRSSDSDEVQLMIDGDYYDKSQSETGEVWSKLGFLHDRASRVLSSAITSTLRDALGPEPMELNEPRN
jgi:uncharacterized protein (TIGR04255 family)